MCIYTHTYTQTHRGGDMHARVSLWNWIYIIFEVLDFVILSFLCGIIHPHQETDYSPIVSYRFKNIFVYVYLFNLPEINFILL